MPCRRSRSRFVHHLGCFRLAAIAVVLFAATGCGQSASRSELPAAATGNIERGRALLAQYQCGSCHTIPGVRSARGQVNASLAGFGQRSYIAGRLANGPQLLAQWIMQPQAMVPGTLMPSMGVSERDARDIAAYLLDLR